MIEKADRTIRRRLAPCRAAAASAVLLAALAVPAGTLMASFVSLGASASARSRATFSRSVRPASLDVDATSRNAAHALAVRPTCS